MWVEIIVAVIGVAGIIFTAHTSKRVAETTAKAEVFKLRETWAHEKELALDADFDEMVAAVSGFLRYGDLKQAIEAEQKTAICRAKATGELATTVDALSVVLSRQNPDRNTVQAKLDAAVEIKRKGHG